MGRLGVASYADLHRISIDEPERFWPEVVDDLGLRLSRRWDQVVDTSRGIEWARWFVGGQLNLAESCGHKWVETDRADEEAAAGGAENAARQALTAPERS